LTINAEVEVKACFAVTSACATVVRVGHRVNALPIAIGLPLCLTDACSVEAILVSSAADATAERLSSGTLLTHAIHAELLSSRANVLTTAAVFGIRSEVDALSSTQCLRWTRGALSIDARLVTATSFAAASAVFGIHQQVATITVQGIRGIQETALMVTVKYVAARAATTRREGRTIITAHATILRIVLWVRTYSITVNVLAYAHPGSAHFRTWADKTTTATVVVIRCHVDAPTITTTLAIRAAYSLADGSIRWAGRACSLNTGFAA